MSTHYTREDEQEILRQVRELARESDELAMEIERYETVKREVDIEKEQAMRMFNEIMVRRKQQEEEEKEERLRRKQRSGIKSWFGRDRR